MRQKRAKTYKRVMALYIQTFGFRQPFQVLISDDFLVAANKDLDLMKQLISCAQGPVKPMITQCCMEALYALGKAFQPTTDLAKRYERRKCNHREAIHPNECLKDVVGPSNKHRYILAVQSQSLRNILSNVPGLPILHFNAGNVLVLAPPSNATMKHKEAMEGERRMEGAKLLDHVVDGENVVGSSETRGVKRRKVKAPNPLSVRKKKGVINVDERAGKDEGVRVKRRRRKEEDEDEEQGERPVEAREGDEGQGLEGQDGTKKRKRKRRGKGEVAKAIEEIRAEKTVVSGSESG